MQALLALLDAYTPGSDEERADVVRLRKLVEGATDPWTRASPLHVTGSALVVHPSTQRVLLRWHQRQNAWLQVGGHADPGETDPFEVALREAREETGLQDLQAWPNVNTPRVVQIAIVPVPANQREPAHEHADIRYTLATAQPQAAVAEKPSAPLAWLTVRQAIERTGEDNLRTCLRRIEAEMTHSNAR